MELIKKLRGMSGAPIMDCKKALKACLSLSLAGCVLMIMDCKKALKACLSLWLAVCVAAVDGWMDGWPCLVPVLIHGGTICIVVVVIEASCAAGGPCPRLCAPRWTD